jgi:hypothetical protein
MRAPVLAALAAAALMLAAASCSACSTGSLTKVPGGATNASQTPSGAPQAQPGIGYPPGAGQPGPAGSPAWPGGASSGGVTIPATPQEAIARATAARDAAERTKVKSIAAMYLVQNDLGGGNIIVDTYDYATGRATVHTQDPPVVTLTLARDPSGEWAVQSHSP